MSQMLQSAIQTAEEMQRSLIERAGEDAGFRAQLVANPKAAVKQEFGIDVPDYVNLQVHESSMSDLHLVLPPDPDAWVELDEETLEAISAGLCCCG
ncbi:MAG: NHLP leader peptide family RiPP precursor [bacterium]|nr:NHLP leader peptide family RiPP precursor [bacterium]